LVWPLAVIAVEEGIEARLLLEDVSGGGLGRLFLQRQMHPLVSTILLGMARFDPLDRDAEAEPPDRQFAQPIERVSGGERHAIVGANRGR
jgi:hypothetical protein